MRVMKKKVAAGARAGAAAGGARPCSAAFKKDRQGLAVQGKG